MIRCITGTILEQTAGTVVIDVRGIGYLVHVTEDWFPTEKTVTLWTYLAVRETSLDLYGFSNRLHCSLFEALLTVPKVGPKSALQILNKASPELITQSVHSRDSSGLAKRSGIGQKTAEKIVNELQDSLTLPEAEEITTNEATNDDAVATLVALGYPERTAYDTVREILQEESGDTNTQTLVRIALKKLHSF